MRPSSSRAVQWALFVALAFWLGGCAGISGPLRETTTLTSQPSDGRPGAEALQNVVNLAELWEDPLDTDLAVMTGGDDAQAPPLGTIASGHRRVFQIGQRSGRGAAAWRDVEIEEYDPLEPFNEVVFEFNRWLDRWVIKPAAKGYNAVMPEIFQEAIANGFDNIGFLPRFVNSLLQGKLAGAGREIGRFLINSSLGLGGLIDIARREPFYLQKSNEDFGQTLGALGIGPGPYLVLPLLPPLTVRDGIGVFVDGFLDPFNHLLGQFPDRFAMRAGDTINDRSLNLELFQGFEEVTVDFYTAVRNAYLQRRLRLLQE